MQKVALNAARDSAVTANKMATELRNKKHPFSLFSIFCFKKHIRNLTKYSMRLLQSLVPKSKKVTINLISTLKKDQLRYTLSDFHADCYRVDGLF